VYTARIQAMFTAVYGSYTRVHDRVNGLYTAVYVVVYVAVYTVVITPVNAFFPEMALDYYSFFVRFRAAD